MPSDKRYGRSHQEKRRRLAGVVAAGKATCVRCGDPIAPGDRWDLDHDDARPNRHLGPAHAHCNRASVTHLKDRIAELEGREPAQPKRPAKQKPKPPRIPTGAELIAAGHNKPSPPDSIHGCPEYLNWRPGEPLYGLPDPEPSSLGYPGWSRHWSGVGFNPRCPRCRELRGPCADAVAEGAA
jgi:hypothetical protein